MFSVRRPLMTNAQRFWTQLTLLLASLHAANLQADSKSLLSTPAPLEIKHNVSGWSGEMKSYQEDLISAVVAAGESKFGPYKLTFVDKVMSTVRAMIASERGALDTGMSTGWGMRENGAEKVDLYLRAYMKSLLGLRQLIIRKEDQTAFRAVRTIDDLRAFKAGQGSGWPDSRIYSHYDVEVVDANSFSALFPMLEKKRFDFIPLSILEVDTALAAVQETYPDFVIAEDIYLFYPIPLYISVSKMSPAASQRIAYGLKVLFHDDDAVSETEASLAEAGGEVDPDELLFKHFPVAKTVSFTGDQVLLMLENPFISQSASKEITEYFIRHYR